MTTAGRERPETGLVRSRLESLHRVLSGYVERSEMPGLVALVSRGADVHVETIGAQSFARPAPMQRDTIFRIASITKLVTAVAAMILVEECKIRLDDSIEPWLPELANRRVLKALSSEIEDTVPADRAITLRDLLTFRMGFGSVMAMPDTYPIQKYIREYQIGGDGPPHPALAPATDEWLRRLGSLPLIAQPGERWMYQVSADVLGVLIGRLAGSSLGAFMKERIFAPLGMKDTGFFIPASELGRFPESYVFSAETNALEIYDGVEDSTWKGQPPFESGGGGLVSTLDDVFAFCRMMLGKGRLGNEQILSRASIAMMTTDQLAAQNREGADIFFGTHSSWGLGMAVCIRRDQIFHVPGRYGWDGGLGTSAYIDPVENVIGILLTQRLVDSPEPPKVYDDFWTLAYAGLQ